MKEKSSKSESQKELLIRIDERTRNLENEVAELKDLVNRQYVTRLEFSPIKNTVYGLITLILTAVIGGLLTLVLGG